MQEKYRSQKREKQRNEVYRLSDIYKTTVMHGHFINPLIIMKYKVMIMSLLIRNNS